MAVYSNCYGFNAATFPRGYDAAEPYQIDKRENVYYARFHNEDVTAIQRCTKDGDFITQEWAWGKWADRTTLTYVPINQLIKITDD